MLFCIVVMAVGFICFKFRIISEEGRKSIGKLAAMVLLAFLIFSSNATSCDVKSIFTDYPFIITMVVLILAQYALAYGVAKILRLKGKTLGAHVGLCCMGNNGFFGLPLFAALFGMGSAGMNYASIFFLIDTIFVWTVGYYFMSGGKLNLKRMISPAFVAIVLGIIANVAGLDLSAHRATAFLAEAIEGLGDVSRYMALLYIGCCIPQIKIKELIKNKALYIMLFTRLLAVPVIIAFALRLLPFINPEQRIVLSLFAATPAMTSLPGIAEATGSDTDYALAGSLTSNMLCLVTLPVIIAVNTLV